MIKNFTAIVGNLTHDPELRHTREGKAVVNFTVASTPRQKNRETGQWEDGEAYFQKCTAWDEYAEAIADSFHKGDGVVVIGVLKPNSWTDKESGVKRTEPVLTVDEMGLNPRHAIITSTKRERGQRADANQTADTWSQPTTVSDETPF